MHHHQISGQRMPGATVSLIIVLLAAAGLLVRAASSPWHLPTGSYARLEREQDQLQQQQRLFESPAQVARLATQRSNGLRSQIAGQRGETTSRLQDSQADMFQCVEPSRELFESFATEFNRTFDDNVEKLDRLNLFATTLKRIIMLNRIVQNEVLNSSNYERKPSIGNYHFIQPSEGADAAKLWYADITDCELGLIKYIVFDIFYLIEQNDLKAALKMALDNSEHLPLLDEEGFQQLANILLVRLYDRFKDDLMMNQLFQWPLYLKKLAGYAYTRRQMLKPDFNARLSLISFAYPTYFKDLKFNWPAVNRTSDNLRAHSEHEKFNTLLGRKFASRSERNKRLAIYRQRWSLISLLNNEHNRSNHSQLPEWLRAYQSSSSLGGVAEKLRASPEQQPEPEPIGDGRFKQTQFSDLTDAEFVAFLTNDFSILDGNKESANYLDANFPIRPLDGRLRGELAVELELRRALPMADSLDGKEQAANGRPRARTSLVLARQVIDELISDVGLPIGSVIVGDIEEQEHYRVFQKLSEFFAKPYATRQVREASGAGGAALLGAELSEAELAEARQRRYEQFKENHGRFKAWWIKENWQLDEQQQVAMMRLADLSWHEIKLTLFKVCCLSQTKLSSLAANNATIQYLASNEFLCQALSEPAAARDEPASTSDEQAREISALELYYYYSMHFNKHHTNMDTFQERFEIFRHNIDRIRWHSCERGLTLFTSLQAKLSEPMNTIDVLDPRRSYTDDINLDRYRYFSVGRPGADPAHLRDAPERAPSDTAGRLSDVSPISRAGVSYRREAFFSSLLERPETRSYASYPRAASNRLRGAGHQLAGPRSYREKRVWRVYDLVMQRYSYCLRTVRQLEPNVSELRQQCQSMGPLGDQAASSGAGWGHDNQLSRAQSLRLQEEDQCAFYRLGLEPWAEGLIRQDLLSAQLIQGAKC